MFDSLFSPFKNNEVAVVTCLRYMDLKQVKKEQQHDNTKMRGDKIPTVRGDG